ncbi:hypothetical protein GCM10027591_09940 [Zhihengliuella somnathii]
MNWLFRTTGAPALAVLLGSGVLLPLLRGHYAPMPSLVSGSLAPVPVIAVLALLPAEAVMTGIDGLPAAQAASASRSLVPYRLLLVAGALALLGLLGLVISGFSAALESVRNSAGLIGLALLGAWWRTGLTALAVPGAYLLAAFLAGGSAGHASAWAWILRDSGDPTALFAAGSLLAAGLLVLPRLPQRTLQAS